MDLRERIAFLKNGEWHAEEKPQQFMAQIDCYSHSWRLERGDYSYRRHAYRGVVFRWTGDKREIEGCPHAHLKPGPAMKCAQRTAARWNREDRNR